MNPVFYFLIIAIVINAESFSQWKPINPRPFLDDCFVIHGGFNNCNVVTRRGNLVTSSDGGNSWNYHFTQSFMQIKKIYFIDENYGWAATTSGISKTTDGGYNWEAIGDSLEFANWDFFFRDQLSGWSVGNAYVKSTTDGGQVWNTHTFSDNPVLRFIADYNDTILFTGGYEFFRTTDKGENWHALPNPLNFYRCRNFLTVNTDSQSVGLLIGDYTGIPQRSCIAKTTDEGNNWELSFPNFSGAMINDLEYYDGLLLTCGNNYVFKSTDLGETWDSLEVPMAAYSKILFASDQIIYISGLNGALIKSTDGGSSFFSLHESLFGVNNMDSPSISLSDSLHGYLATKWTPPKIYKTSDGGYTFTDITPIGLNNDVIKIYAVSNQMVVVSSDNRILTTKNGGESWKISSYGPINTYVAQDFYFKDTLNGMAGCSWNLIRETTNGGDSWTNRSFGTTQEHINFISFPDQDYGYFSTSNKLYKTTNGGVDWEFLSYKEFGKFKFVDRTRGVAYNGSAILNTIDGGLSWTNGALIDCIDFDIKKNGQGSVLFLLTYDSLHISYDLGITFESEIIPFSDLKNITMINPATAWFSGTYGKLVGYHNPSIPLDVQLNNSNNIIENYTLKQNYPNPFNPSTKISWQSPVGSWQTLKVFDVLGREVVTLVNEYRNAGSYEVEFNSAGLASGVYYYQLKSGSYVQTKKMILLR